MATMRTDYVDDVLDTDVNLVRKYTVTENTDGTISLEDTTTYTQNGDVISASDINTINTQINTNTDNIATNTANITTLTDTTIPNLETTLQEQITTNATDIDTLESDKVNSPDDNGTSGQVLTSNGDGTTYWSTPSSSGSSGEVFIEPSNTVVFNDDGSITETFTTSESTLDTVFNDDGSITTTYVNATEGTTTTSVIVFNDDGSITTTTTTV